MFINLKSVSCWLVFLTTMIAMLSSPLRAVPAYPDSVDSYQPDGRKIALRLQGDEFFSWHEDANGYAIQKDKMDNFWKYAIPRKGSTQLQVIKGARVGEVDPKTLGLKKRHLPDLGEIRKQKAKRWPAVQPIDEVTSSPSDITVAVPPILRIPVAGTKTIKNIVILACFSDHWDNTNNTVLSTKGRPQSEYVSLFNEIGHTTDSAVGSVKDYFLEVSYGKLTVDSVVTAWIRLPQTMVYYDSNPGQMVRDALSYADAGGFDFSVGDSDGDGWVDGFTIIHSGHGEEYTGNSSDNIWSHKSNIAPQTYDGVKFCAYHTEPALRGSDTTSTSIIRIGVICHETGHFFGLPDLYDTGGSGQTNYTVGVWGAMSGGSWGGGDGKRPCHFSAWCKQSLGFVTPKVIHSQTSISVPDVTYSDTIYMVRDGVGDQEYFLIENRNKTGFDASIPGRGIVIWHIDPKSNNNAPARGPHPLVKMEDADGDGINVNQTDAAWYAGNGSMIAGGLQDWGGNNQTNSMIYNDTDWVTRPDNSAFYTYVRVNNFSAQGATMTCDVQTLIPTVTSQSVTTPSYVVTWSASSDATTYELQEGSQTTTTAFSDSFENEDDMHDAWVLAGCKRSNEGANSGSYCVLLRNYDGSNGSWWNNVQFLRLRNSFKLTASTSATFSYIGGVSGNGVFRFQASSDGGNTWKTLWSHSSGRASAWTPVTVDAAAFTAAGFSTGDDLLLMFSMNIEQTLSYSTFPYSGWAIDDLSISDATITGYTGWTSLDSNISGTSFSVGPKTNGTYAYRVRGFSNSAWQRFSPAATVTVEASSVSEIDVARGGSPIVNGSTETIASSEPDTAIPLTYVISNNGGVNLTLSPAATAGATTNCSVAFTSQPTSPVAPSGSDLLELTVTPTDNGFWSATISIDNNDADRNPYTWTIEGTAAAIYTISYNADTADTGLPPGDQLKTHGQNLTLATNTGNLARTGYALSGWNTTLTGDGVHYELGGTYSIDADDILYAEWRALPTYTVTYFGNNNTSGTAPDQQIKTQGIDLTLSNNIGNLTKTDSTFIGWNTLADGIGTDYAEGSTYTVDADLDLYAKWNAVPIVNAGPDQTVFLVGGGAPWTPAEIATAAWYDASDTGTITHTLGAVSKIDDKSGNGRHIDQTNTAKQPTTGSRSLNGLNVVDFDGIDDFIDRRRDFPSDDFALFQVCVIDTIASSNDGIYAWQNEWQVTANNASQFNGLNNSNNIGDVQAWTGGPYNGAAHLFNTNLHWDISASLPLSYHNSFVDGVQVSANALYDTKITSSTSLRLRLMTNWNNSFTVDGALAETIIVADATESTRQMIEGYLAHKWGLVLPLGHPYKDVPPGGALATATLAGSVTDSDSSPTYSWSDTGQGTGTGTVTFVDDKALNSDVTFTDIGTYILQLTADDGTLVTDNVVITVNPVPSTYTVTYDANGADSGAVPVDASSPYDADALVTVIGNTGGLSLTGSSFAGWNTADDGNGTPYAAGETFTITANTTLFAQWAPNSVILETDLPSVDIAEGSTNIFQVRLSEQPATAVTVSIAPVSGGDTDISVSDGASLIFTTDDWNVFQPVTLAAAEDNTDTTDGTAIIRCTATGGSGHIADVTANEADDDFTLTVNNDGNGTTDPSGPVIVDSNNDLPFDVSATPNASYDFAGWSDPSAVLTDAAAASTTVKLGTNTDSTITATFSLNNSPVIESVAWATPEIVAPAENTTLQVVANDPDGDALTYTWAVTAGTGTPTFDGNNGTAAGNSVIASFDTVDVYTLTVTVSDGVSTPATSSCTVSVVAPMYTVTLNPEGGSGGTATVEAYVGQAMPEATAPTLIGYTFGGYFTGTNGTGTQYYSDAMGSAQNWDLEADTMLYAKWTLNTVNVITDIATVDVNEGSTNTFQVKLSAQPIAAVSVTVAHSAGDTDISVTGGASLSFDTDNWDTYQLVTLTAEEDDADTSSDNATISCTASGAITDSVNVTANEVDDDFTLTVNSVGAGTTTPSGVVIVDNDLPYPVTATPDAGKVFVNWTDASNVLADANAASTAVKAGTAADCTIIANFASQGLLVYEGFQYGTAGADRASSDLLHGQPDGVGGDIAPTGLGPMWEDQTTVASTSDLFLYTGSLAFGDLPTSGNSVRSDTYLNNDTFTIPVTANLAGVSELWFSILANQRSSRSVAQGGFVIGDQAVNNSKINSDSGSDGLEGFGVGPTSSGGNWTAYAWNGTSQTAGDANLSVAKNGSDTRLLVGKIVYNAGAGGTDQYSLYEYQLNAGSVVGGTLSPICSTIEVNVDENLLNTLSLTRQTNIAFDEIRIGETLASVVPGPTAGASIAGTEIFYNNSAWDGDAGASANDDLAIASTKSALLPGGTATFANYTSYDKGINGIMIDVDGMTGTPDASDFTFVVGNDSTPGSWIPAPAPTSITVRAGAGTGGSDRITIIWADGAISKEWLQVTVNTGGNVGLESDYVFYFGNAIGEVGNSAGDALVNASDALGMRANPQSISNASLDDVYDCNRDKAVNATDVLKARSNATTTANMLQLITP